MPYTLIRGELHIYDPDHPRQGPEPDGDTLRFKPDRRELIDALPRQGPPAAFNRQGTTSIRFEAIDTLETHFEAGGERTHQRLDLALGQRDALLAAAGFGNVRFFDDLPFKVQSVQHHPVRAWLLSNGLDSHGRTIAFVFVNDVPAPRAASTPGDPPAGSPAASGRPGAGPAWADGTRVYVTPEQIEASLNAFMLREGQAYAGFYSTLPASLREPLREHVQAARRRGLGVYAHDALTLTRGARIPDLAALQQLALWPKLFRRLAAFFADGGADLSALDAWLRQDPVNRDDRLLMPDREIGNMHDMLALRNGELRLRVLPEDVVIVPDNFVLNPGTPGGPPPVRPPAGPAAEAARVRIVAALVDPAGSDRGHESVTLLNTAAADQPLAGWTLGDAAGTLALQGVLKAGDALRVPLGNSVRLANERDTLTLRDADGSVVHQVSYEAKALPAPGHTLVF